MRVREIMTADPEVLTSEDPISRAAEVMRSLDVGCVPIVDGRKTLRLLGVITDRDIAIRHVALGHRGDCAIAEHMTKDELRVVAPDAEVEDAVRIMADARVRRLPVVERGRVVGLLSAGDVARGLAPQRLGTVGEMLERISEPIHVMA